MPELRRPAGVGLLSSGMDRSGEELHCPCATEIFAVLTFSMCSVTVGSMPITAAKAASSAGATIL